MIVLIVMMPFLGAWLAYSSLRSAVDAFEQAQREIRTRDGDVAELFRDAIADTGHARDLLVDPAVQVLGVVTGTQDDMAAGRELAAIAGDAIAIALDVWLLLDELGPRLYPSGQIDFDTVEELSERLDSYSGDIAELEGRLTGADRGSLEVVQEAFDRAEDRIASAESALQTAQRALTILPDLFGANGPRRYLVAFLTPSEARGGGGLLGVFSVLSADDGRLDLGEVYTNDEINDRLGERNVRAPKWFDKLYGNLTALNDVRQANLSVAFPETARVMLEMYRKALGDELDGLITLDPVALGDLSRALGPLRARGWNKSITPSNARRLLLRDIYLKFPLSAEGRQNAYLARLVDNVWSKINEGDFPIGAMGAALAGAAAAQHLKVFSAAPTLQEVVRDIGIGGDPTVAAPNVQSFFHNNFAGNKIDYHLDRTQTVDIELQEDGSAQVATEVRIENDAPTEPVNLINQPLNRNLPVGLARMTVHFVLPEEAKVTGAEIDGRRTQFFRGEDSGLPARWSTLNVEASESSTLRIEYMIPDAIRDDKFEFTLWPQALPFADRFSMSVWAPPGSSVVAHDFGTRIEDRFQARGRLRTPRTFTIEF